VGRWATPSPFWSAGERVRTCYPGVGLARDGEKGVAMIELRSRGILACTLLAGLFACSEDAGPSMNAMAGSGGGGTGGQLTGGTGGASGGIGGGGGASGTSGGVGGMSGGLGGMTGGIDAMPAMDASTEEDGAMPMDDGGTPEGFPPLTFPTGDDPGTGPWDVVSPENVAAECGLDPALLEMADETLAKSYAIVRYGKLCHEYYAPGEPTVDQADHVFSASKTLAATTFGAVVYHTRDIPRAGDKTGPLSDMDRVDYWLDDFTFNEDAQVAHVLAMTAYNEDLSHGAKMFMYDANGSREIQRLGDIAEVAIAQDAARLGSSLEDFAIRFIFEPLGMEDSTWSAFSGPPPQAYGWNATVRDMLRLGLLLVRGGRWDGQTLLGADWVYTMTHPAFEDANAGYGYLTWLSAGACAPSAIHRTYPHGLSEATDCGSAFGCEQTYDVGVFQAVGAGGQYIVGHRGLDLVIAIKNYEGDPVWDVVRPALIAEDPTFMGDSDAFCSAYRAGDYAPALE